MKTCVRVSFLYWYKSFHVYQTSSLLSVIGKYGFPIEWTPGTCAPSLLGPNSFNFMQFSAKTLQNNRLAHPPFPPGVGTPSGKSWIRHYNKRMSFIVSSIAEVSMDKMALLVVSVYDDLDSRISEH